MRASASCGSRSAISATRDDSTSGSASRAVPGRPRRTEVMTMDVLKVAAIVVLALGSTWAAGQVTARWAEPPSLGIAAALAEDGAATGTPATAPESTPEQPAASEPDPRDAGKGKPTESI